MSKSEVSEGFIDLGEDIGGIKEPQPVKTGQYNLTIEGAKGIIEDVEGTKMLTKVQVLINFDDEPGAATLFHNVSMPLPTDDPKKAAFKKVMLKKFFTLFKIPFDGGRFNTQDFAGCRAERVNVELSSYTNPETGKVTISNRIAF